MAGGPSENPPGILQNGLSILPSPFSIRQPWLRSHNEKGTWPRLRTLLLLMKPPKGRDRSSYTLSRRSAPWPLGRHRLAPSKSWRACCLRSRSGDRHPLGCSVRLPMVPFIYSPLELTWLWVGLRQALGGRGQTAQIHTHPQPQPPAEPFCFQSLPAKEACLATAHLLGPDERGEALHRPGGSGQRGLSPFPGHSHHVHPCHSLGLNFRNAVLTWESFSPDSPAR